MSEADDSSNQVTVGFHRGVPGVLCKSGAPALGRVRNQRKCCLGEGWPRSFRPFKMSLLVMAFLWIFPLGPTAADEPLSYKGHLRLPLELQTPEGHKLEKGGYDIEVRLDLKTLLVFSVGEQVVAQVEGSRLKMGEASGPATIPIVGTTFLQSSAVPVDSDAERRYSKTGRPQYVEETYDWRGTLRVLRPLKSKTREVHFFFHEQGQGERHTRLKFTLFSIDRHRLPPVQQKPS